MRSLRDLGRSVRARGRLVHPQPPTLGPEAHDSWLQHFYGEELAAIDAACAQGGPERFALFRDLDADLWALLLCQQQEAYPHIAELLPDVPPPDKQELFNGASGVALAAQSVAFYRKLTDRYAQHSPTGLAASSALDFGCGWGRLTRYLARDVEPGRLYGCDPVAQALDMCADCGVPATFARSEFVPERLPFDEAFDLAFSFSVFTHISERAHESCLAALHAGLAPGGILVVTIRPPEYLRLNPLLAPVLDSLGPDPAARLEEPLYLFTPHPAEDSHPQYEGGEMTFGETVITLPYVRERWADRFELLDVDLIAADVYQVMLTLRRR